jgi:hypothetical protein
MENRNGLRRLWINLTVEAAIKRGFAFPLFLYSVPEPQQTLSDKYCFV